MKTGLFEIEETVSRKSVPEGPNHTSMLEVTSMMVGIIRSPAVAWMRRRHTMMRNHISTNIDNGCAGVMCAG